MKNVFKATKTLTLLSVITLAYSAGAIAGADIPQVPADVISNGVPAHIDAKLAGVSQARVNEQSSLVMEPGVNEIVPVAIGHLNRIVTPFSKPEISTTSEAKTDVKQNVVYVSTTAEVPVTLFITENGDQSRALSLTLVPQRIPPREIFLSLPHSLQMGGMVSNARAESWEQSQPYIETIRSVFRNIAIGEVPQGYTMSGFSRATQMPSCQMPGVSFDFRQGQVLQGHNLAVVVGVARNTSGQTLEIKESACGAWDVAAVAMWPRNVLESGQTTEIYVARKVNRQGGPVSKRPSLVGGY